MERERGQPTVEAAAAGAASLRFDNPVLQVERLSFWYGAARALDSITLDIPAKKITAFIGPSGCGKATLLNLRPEADRFSN